MIADSAAIPWTLLRDGWSTLPRHSRVNYLGAAAACLHDLWRHHADLSDIRPDNFSFRTDLGPVTGQLLSVNIRRLDKPMTQARIMDFFADLLGHYGDEISRRDRLVLLRAFLRLEGADRATVQFSARRVVELAASRARARAAAVYRRHLALHDYSHWAPDPGLTDARLARAVAEAEARHDHHLIKSGPRIRVMRSEVLGEDALIKRYDLTRFTDRIRYRFRASRGRRAWAAAMTLRELGIPTPEPLGFLELRKHGSVTTSYIITRYLPDAMSTYRWLKVNYRRQSDSWKNAFRSELLSAFLSLYRVGLYHADTKLPNLLIRNGGNPGARELLWTDLECVAAGRKPTRHKIIRNLVQMNGSMRYWVPESDRLQFLSELAKVMPWVKHPDVIRKIRKWTQRRLERERRRHTRPDGLLSIK